MTSLTRPTGTDRPARRRFQPLRDLPAVLWLVAVVVVTLAHREVPAPRWLMFHLLLLGAATHSILVWSQHFADTLLHAAPSERQLRARSIRLALVNLGALAVVAGMVLPQSRVVAIGALAVSTAVVWHGADLARQLRGALGSRFAGTVRYYVAAASLLPVGALLGALMSRGLGDEAHARVMSAHVQLNILGWVGLTVLGTLITLWPTMLRTRMHEDAVRSGVRALPVLYGSLVVAIVATLGGVPLVAGLGLLGYAAGIVLLARPFVTVARRKPPVHFPTWSVMAGVTWFAGLVVTCAAMVATAPDSAVAHERLSTLTPALAVGFVAQVLLGALSYLVPVNVGRSPSGTRAANTVLDRGAALRVVAANTGMVVFMLPVPSWVSVAVSLVVVAALASFVPLLFMALRAARRANAQPVTPRPRLTGPAAVAGERPAGQRTGQAVAGFIAVVLAVAVGVAVDPTAVGRGSAEAADGGVAATGHTTTVEVEAHDMRFHPASVDVPAGDRLVIELTNTDDVEVHDLVLDSGHDSGRLRPGESTTIDVGVVGRDLGGWCSIVGHRQMGMTFDVNVAGGAAPAADHGAMSHGGDGGEEPPTIDLMADPGPGFTAYDATLPAPPDATVHRTTLTVTEQVQEVAPGITQRRWTFNGTAPGPVLHGKVGDVFEVTLVNEGSMGHSVDFHAGERAPDEVMRTIPPDESLVYRFRANRAGIWMYHCSTMPMSAHIANGMFGAVVIEPDDLPEVDRSYVLVQSEVYLGGQGQPVDVDKVQAERPDLVVFNGHANQYDHDRLTARVGERVRMWVLDAGPNRASSFHVVGEQFDTVWTEGTYRLPRGSGGAQVLPLMPAQGGFVELEFDEPGTYPFVSHVMVDAERGAHGYVRVTK